MQLQAIVTIDCGAIPQQYLLTFDVSNPAPGGKLQVSVAELPGRDS
jgi:hypothetical protein